MHGQTQIKDNVDVAPSDVFANIVTYLYKFKGFYLNNS
jgi:hypothetical protein